MINSQLKKHNAGRHGDGRHGTPEDVGGRRKSGYAMKIMSALVVSLMAGLGDLRGAGLATWPIHVTSASLEALPMTVIGSA